LINVYDSNKGSYNDFISVEHAYQSLRFGEMDKPLFIHGGALSPLDNTDDYIGILARDAYNHVEKYRLHPLGMVGDEIWTQLREFMEQKFEQEIFQKVLLETGNKYLAYKSDNPNPSDLDELGCTIDDDKQIIGENKAGFFLMNIRKELQSKLPKKRDNKHTFDNNDYEDDDSENDMSSYGSEPDDDEIEGEQDDDDDYENFNSSGVFSSNKTFMSKKRSINTVDIDDDDDDNQPDFESLDVNEKRYLPIGYVCLSKIQQTRIVHDALVTGNFDKLSKVNNAIIKQVADEMYVLIGEDNFDEYVKNEQNCRVIAYLKYAEQRDSFIQEEENQINE
jgi:hypothetical protein